MVFAAICSAILACHGHLSKTSAAEAVEPGTLKVIVYHETPGLSFKDKVGFKRNLAHNLGLPVLTGGYSGLHLRVWARDSTNTTWVIDLRKTSKGCGCTILSYTGRMKDTIYYIYIHEQRDVKPKSDWVNFFNKLEKYHIPEMEKRTLPKDREFSFTSMTYVQFEIDEPNEYRYIEYPDPIFFRNEDKTSKNIDEFFRYFNAEMGTTIYDTGNYENG
jgi:hypothetical protein